MRPSQADDPPSAVGPVMKLFQSGRLPAERQATVVEMICNRGNEHDLRVIFDKVTATDGFAPDLRLKAMNWLSDAASTRKVKPAGDLVALNQLIGAKEPALQLAAIRLASAWKVTSISAALQNLALSEAASPQLQQAAIDGLVAIGDAGSRETLLKLSSSGRRTAIRMQAVAGLVSLDAKLAAAQAAIVLSEATPQDDPAVCWMPSSIGKTDRISSPRLSKKRSWRWMSPSGRYATCTRWDAAMRLCPESSATLRESPAIRLRRRRKKSHGWWSMSCPEATRRGVRRFSGAAI